MSRITSDLLLHAYAQGYFPMAESAESEDLFWVDPEYRGIIPLDTFRIPRRLARTIRTNTFTVTTNQSFTDVIQACSGSARGREKTWINPLIIDLYGRLHREGHAHSVECWQDGLLAGGLYGVSLGAAFFGESMFNRGRDASKVALVHLVARLRAGGFRLLDTQFVTPHLQQFGAHEVPRARYRSLLLESLAGSGDFSALPSGLSGSSILQLITHTS